VVNSPARCSFASITGSSRRSVLIDRRLSSESARRHDHTFMAKSCDLPMQPIAARVGFVAVPQSLTASLAQALDKLADVIGAVQKIAKLTYFPTARPTCNRDRNRRFVDIHSHEDGNRASGPVPMSEDCAGLSDAILEWDMP
jgi:hypothetical protein